MQTSRETFRSEDRSGPLATALMKVRWRIYPLFVVMFVVNYIDRVNIGFAREQLEPAAGIGAAAFGLGAGLFFVGYALFEVPSNMIMTRVGARMWMTRIMFTWGVAAMAMALVQGPKSFYLLRFLLGVAEAGFFPGVVYYFTCWLPARERGKAMAIFLSGSAVASILSGPIAGALLMLKAGSIAGWQWMFLIEGAFAIALCLPVWLLLRAKPRDAEWLTEQERSILESTIARERAAVNADHARSLRRLLRDPRIFAFCLIYFGIQMTIYGITFWLPTVIGSFAELTSFEIGLLNSGPWLVAVVAMYGFAILSSSYGKPQHWLALALAIASLGMFMAGRDDSWAAYVWICFGAIGFKSAASLFWPIPQAYLDARIAAGVLALINSLGNLGGFVAPALFGVLYAQTGSVSGGMTGLGIMSGLVAILALATRTSSRAFQTQAEVEGS